MTPTVTRRCISCAQRSAFRRSRRLRDDRRMSQTGHELSIGRSRSGSALPQYVVGVCVNRIGTVRRLQPLILSFSLWEKGRCVNRTASKTTHGARNGVPSLMGRGPGGKRFPQFIAPSGRKTASYFFGRSSVALAYPLNQPISIRLWKGGQGWRSSSCPQARAARSQAEPSARRLARFARMAACAGGARPAPRLP